jgi:hypothetical protein
MLSLALEWDYWFSYTGRLARGYWVSTVGRDEAVIRDYIRQQEQEDVPPTRIEIRKPERGYRVNHAPVFTPPPFPIHERVPPLN